MCGNRGLGKVMHRVADGNHWPWMYDAVMTTRPTGTVLNFIILFVCVCVWPQSNSPVTIWESDFGMCFISPLAVLLCITISTTISNKSLRKGRIKILLRAIHVCRDSAHFVQRMTLIHLCHVLKRGNESGPGLEHFISLFLIQSS